MASNPEIVRNAARNMVDRYGFDALGEVDKRIMELEAERQGDAVELWREIRKVVEDLLGPPDGGVRH